MEEEFIEILEEGIRKRSITWKISKQTEEHRHNIR